MEESKIQRLTSYLIDLAPEYFSAGIKPAAEEDLARLEVASKRRVVGTHREFLLAMGNTNAGDLDPFLNGRVFNVEELIHAYSDLEDDGFSLAPDISLFSAPDSYGDFEFIRTHDILTTNQEIGIFNFETGEFIPELIGTLEDYLQNFAFTFRVGQLEHIRKFSPRGSRTPELCKKVLVKKELRLVFQFANCSDCYEGGPWAVEVFSDGSGHVASNDREALFNLCGLLEYHANMEIQPRPRLAAPKR